MMKPEKELLVKVPLLIHSNMSVMVKRKITVIVVTKFNSHRSRCQSSRKLRRHVMENSRSLSEYLSDCHSNRIDQNTSVNGENDEEI
jgi:hypothetical protein